MVAYNNYLLCDLDLPNPDIMMQELKSNLYIAHESHTLALLTGLQITMQVCFHRQHFADPVKS